MEHRVRLLLSKSFKTLQAVDYNQVRYLMTNAPGERMAVCETAIPEDSPWEHVKEHVYPPLCRYLRGKRFDPTNPRVVVAVFYGDSCHLIHGPDFMQAYREIECLDPPDFKSLVGSWLNPA